MDMGKFEDVIEAQTGMPIDWIRKTPVCEQRKYFERKHGRPMSVVNCGRIISDARDFYRLPCRRRGR